MLAMQMVGKSDSWAIRWAYTHFKHNALALLSFGHGSFILVLTEMPHIPGGVFKQLPLTEERKAEFHFPETTKLEESFVLELQRSFRPSFARKVVRYLLHGRVRMAANRADSSKSVAVEAEHSTMPKPTGSSTFD